MGEGGGAVGADLGGQLASGAPHEVRARDGWRVPLQVAALGITMVFVVGLANGSDALQLVGFVGLVVAFGVMGVAPERSVVRSLSFSSDGVTAAVRGADAVCWARPGVAAVGVRGATRGGLLVPIRTWSGPVRPAFVVLLDAGGRVVDAPSIAWVRVRDVQAAAEATGLGWAGRLGFHPVPSVPVARPEGRGLDVAGTLVAKDPHVGEALADHDGPSAAARVGMLAVLAGVVALASVVAQSSAVLVPGIVVVIGAAVLFVADSVLDRVRRRATQAAIDDVRDHLTWAAAECIVLDVPPSAPSQEAVVVLGPDGREVVAALRLEAAPTWLRSQRRQWLLLARDDAGGRGVVALPDRSRATPVGAKPFDVRLVAAWMTGPDAVASRDGRSAWPSASAVGVVSGSVRHDGG